MQARILVIDDEPEIVSFVKEALEAEGYIVEVACDGHEAIRQAQTQPDLILLDVMMPGLDGYAVCQAIRNVVACPIMFVSAREREADRVKGLAVGGDDYLVKPFGIKELRARVQAHLRREQRTRLDVNRQVVSFGDLAIDIKGFTVTYRNERIPFTHREFQIIKLLALHPGQVFSREQIYDKIWGLEAVGDSSTVTEHVKKIRSKLSIVDPSRQYINTIWGVGYKWEIAN